MNCQKCLTDIPSAFSFAIKNNQCPGCGGRILSESRMKTFLQLKEELGKVELVLDKDTNCERIAMFIISKFNIQAPTSSQQENKELIKQDNGIIIKERADDQEPPEDTSEEINEEKIRERAYQEARDAAELKEAEEFFPGTSLSQGDKNIDRLKRMAQQGQVKSTFSVRRSDVD